MYRSNLGAKDRSGAIIAVVAIHAALLLAFLHISGKISFGETQSVLRVWWAELLRGEPTALEHRALRWLARDEIDDVAWLPSDAPVVARCSWTGCPARPFTNCRRASPYSRPARRQSALNEGFKTAR